jgi:PAS domain S-box-containing protein
MKISTYGIDRLLGIDKLLRSVAQVMTRENYILLDEKGTILSWNREFEKLFAYTALQVQNQNFNIFFLPEERQKSTPESLLKEAAMKGSLTHRIQLVRKDGSIFAAAHKLVAIRSAEQELLGFESFVSRPGYLAL